MIEKNSRLPGFHNLLPHERIKALADFADLDEDDIEALIGPPFRLSLFNLYLKAAVNFKIDNAEKVIPMVVEESSVTAAACNAAKQMRAGGGIATAVQGSVVRASVSIEPDEYSSKIVEASVFAEKDPYRAATHNKGIMNGIDALVLAIGSDVQEAEVLAHSFATKNGLYKSLSRWRMEKDVLVGEITLPLLILEINSQNNAVASVCLKILGNPELLAINRIAAALGLAQNYAALHALVSKESMDGHMKIHKTYVQAMIQRRINWARKQAESKGKIFVLRKKSKN